MTTLAFKGWDKLQIQTAQGPVTGVAPVIISASRATDIPAFYSDWFFKRLAAGYVKWINPFNHQEQYVSFEKARVIVFWTKNARPMLSRLPELDAAGINYYFTFTVNDYETEGLEPNVPKLSERIETFRRLADRLGKERVIWRFDPLILSDTLTSERLLDKVYRVGEELNKYTAKLVVSFADIACYQKVRRNITAGGFGALREFDRENMERVAAGLRELNKSWGLEIATCAEKIDLGCYGIKHNRCIDDRLMARVFKSDQALMKFLGEQDHQEPRLFTPVELGEVANAHVHGRVNKTIDNPLKDKGQRFSCGCVVSKDIGQYNTCMHLCLYCYANYSEQTVRENIAKFDPCGETITSL